MAKSQSRRCWSTIVDRYRRSGMMQAEFCRSEGIAASNLSCQLRRASQKLLAKQSHGFIELVQVDESRSPELEIVLPNGTAIRLRG